MKYNGIFQLFSRAYIEYRITWIMLFYFIYFIQNVQICTFKIFWSVISNDL
jgi:hypothetical protein